MYPKGLDLCSQLLWDMSLPFVNSFVDFPANLRLACVHFQRARSDWHSRLTLVMFTRFQEALF